MSTPSRDWREVIAPNEETEFAAIAAELAALATERYGGTAQHRALHPKRHLGARATLTVRGDLPDHARQGLFAAPGDHHAYVRFSNGAGRFQHDREPDLRGIALKVLDVDGPKVLGEARTQDFLMVDVPKLAFRDVGEFMAIVRAGKDPKKLPQRLIGALGFFSALGLIGRVLAMAKGKRGTLADLTYYSVTPIAFGPYAGRLSLAPRHDRDPDARAGADRDYLRDDLVRRQARHTLRYDLRAQFFTTDAETPIERVDAEWPTPWVVLGTLTFEPATGDPSKRDALDQFVEKASFDPWHALVDHRPLGSAMRARKHAYYASTQARKAAAEPDGTEWARFA
jgi:hypothetical protein